MDRKLTGTVALLLVAAVACGSSDKPSETAAGATSTTAAGDEPDLEATFRWAAIGNAASNYDPHTANNPGATQYTSAAYDRLIYLDPEGKLQPMLATEWAFSADGTAFTAKLRSGVTFHDGEAFDAAAVKANIERAKTLDKSSLKNDLAAVSSVDVVGPLEVRFALSAPNAALPALLADRAGMMISPKAFGNADLALRPVGAGPYKVVEHQPGTLLVFERYDGYWDKEAQRLRRIEMTMPLDGETRLRSLTSGQVDGMVLTVDQLATAGQAKVEVEESDQVHQVMTLFLNKTRSEFAKPEVRRAISYAIDRKGIGAALYDGRCKPTGQPFPPSSPYFDPSVKPDAFDPAMAKSMLTKAGVADGFGFDSVMANVTFLVAQAEAMQAQLGEVGLKMKVEPLEPAQVLARFLTEKSADSWLSALQTQVDPARSVLLGYLPTSVYNPGGYENATISKLAADGLSADESARASVYRQISKEVARDLPHIPICSLPLFWGHAAKVRGLSPNLTATFDFREVWIAK